MLEHPSKLKDKKIAKLKKDNMLAVPLLSIELEDWKYRKKHFKNLCNINDPKYKNKQQYSDYHYYLNNGCSYIKTFEDLIKNELSLVKNKLGGDFWIDGLWTQRYEKLNHMSVHNHGNQGYSAILFVDFDAKHHMPTTFFAPFVNFITGESLSYEPNIIEGTMIFFPSVLLHQALPNTSNKPRTVISFNLSPGCNVFKN